MSARDGLVHDNNFNLIRLLAALQVAVVHSMNHFAYEFPGSNALRLVPGVPTFFFISGYLIYQSFDRVRHKGVGSFFINRVLRIYPGLIVCVALATTAVWLTGYFTTHPVPLTRLLAWLGAQTTIFQFYNPDFMRDFGVGVLNGVLWTVSIELQFYLLVPLLFYLIKRRAALAGVLFALSLATNLYLRLFLDWQELWMKLLYVSFIPWLYMFMFGAALVAFERLRDFLLGVNVYVLVGVYLLSMNFIGSYETNASNAMNPIAFVALAGLTLKLARARIPLPQAVTRSIRKEDVSYGLYLYHMPTINLLLVTGVATGAANMFLALAISMLAAAFSWYVVERPALRHKR